MNLEVLTLGSGWGYELIKGLGTTITLAICSIVLGTILGLGCALVQRGQHKLSAYIVAGIGVLLRSLPELLVVFAIYYGLSASIGIVLAPFGIKGFVTINSFTAGILSIGLIHASYAMEVFGGALAAVPKGQLEAAAALGLSRFACFRFIELPLAIRFALPGLVNLSVMALKVTPFVSAIGLQDLLRTATDAGKNTKDYVLFYVVTLALYLLISAVVYAVQLHVEHRLAVGSSIS
jgi:His/Glu/Gln/Arg/opine family amino acid ABC transporter permease subunit